MLGLKNPFTSACLIAISLLALFLPAGAQESAAAPSQSAPQDIRPVSTRFADINKADDPSFRREVVPLLARAGCSSRNCHGSFQGRGGFQLSLFGSDWDHDYVQLTQSKGDEDELHINQADPEKSLILMKPTMQMHHKGKLRFKKDSWQYNIFLKWIRDGAKNDAEQNGELQRLEVQPTEMVFSQLGQAIQLKVLAHWGDGSVRDVTDLTRFKTNDETVAAVSDTGLVTCVGKGDSHIVSMYDNGVVPTAAMLPVSQFAGDRFPNVPTHTKVDELVMKKLRKMGILPSPICEDADFLRRVNLDLTGTLPTPSEITQFLADHSPNKRSAKIDELLKTPAYAAWWTTKFCDFTGDSPAELRIGGNIQRNSGEVARQWYDWLYQRVSSNMPYDQLVSEIVLSTSRTSPQQSYQDYTVQMDSYFRADNPVSYAQHPTLPYFWQRKNVQLPQEKALAFSHAFLGVKLECAQCHKHPFDRWTKKDLAQFTAFFNPITYNPRPEGPGDDVSYKSILKDLQKKAAEDVDAREEKMTAASASDAPSTDAKTVDGKPIVAKGEDAAPAKGKLAKTKFDIHKQQMIRKEMTAEIERRVDAGEPAPWPELWTSKRPIRKYGKKQGSVDPNATPKILGGAEVKLTDYADPRQPLMDWLRSPSNPYFAKAFVNRVWAAYFNRGIVDPPDDMNLANAPCNAELLDYLADGFRAHHFDMKWLHREILNSDTYQRSWKTNPTNLLDERNFSHCVVRQLPAEVMLDAIDMAIAPDDKLASYQTDIDTRAIGPDGIAQGKPGKGKRGNNDGYFLTLFGRPVRETNCDCERSTDPTLLQTIFTRNDPQLLAKIDGYGGGKNVTWIGQMRRQLQGRGRGRGDATAASFDVDKTIEQVFLRTVSRPPTAKEMSEAHSDITSAKNPLDGVRDLLWAMLNTREFKVNH